MEGFQMLYWHWLVFGMILMLLELVVPSFTIFWFGLGGLVVGVLLLVSGDQPTSGRSFCGSWLRRFRRVLVPGD